MHLKSAAIEGITLAVYRGINGHGVVCRESLIIECAANWVEGRRLLKMRPRGPENSVARPSRAYFRPWSRNEADYRLHVVDG